MSGDKMAVHFLPPLFRSHKKPARGGHFMKFF
nr:MAG TPA: hypothetical protein [Caudoviricetes sp.]